MRLLILGGGGREHALAWKLSQSPLVSAIWAAPGNPGIAAHASCEAVDASNPAAVVALARAKEVDLVVVGPEAPLVAGVGDALRAAGVDVFGPSCAAANIEGSKAFAKEIMQAAGVLTARFESFDDAGRAADRARAWGAVVVKADGLAAGKGVVVASSGAEAAEACLSLGRGLAGRRVLLEERLEGPELSVIALCDGVRYVLLPPAQDHKRLFDGDRGPNTGGMGAYTPANLLTAAELDEVGRTVIAPTLTELSRRGMPFRGALYAGLMLTPAGVRVLEFNCRLGDPETQPLMMQVDEDLVPFLQACARGALRTGTGSAGGGLVRSLPGVSVGVVLAAHGYPESPRSLDVIRGLDAPPLPGTMRFHAGTRQQGRDVVTAGGRVLTVCAHGPTFAAAQALAYAEAARVDFDGKHYRRDIGVGAR